MRDIKFRAWLFSSPTHGQFSEPAMRHESNATLFEWEQYGMGMTLMQFTGLVDKNGVEIYEGDLVEYRSQSIVDRLTGSSMTTYQKPVVWDENRYCWWVGSPENGFKPNKEVDDGKFLVVGNVYQNPELLPNNDDRRA